MTLIEGIGDEVIHFFVLLAIVLIALVAWWSTNISERPLMRTVLILERRATRHTPNDNQTNLVELRDTTEITPETNEPEAEEKTSHPDNETNSQIGVNVMEQIDNIMVNREEINTINTCEEACKPSAPLEEENKPSILLEEACESSTHAEKVNGSGDSKTTDESAVVRNRRIAFFQNKEEPTEIQKQNKNLKDMIEESSSSTETEAHSSNEGNIRIRLKYLNDDLKLVEGKLQEQLGEFKRRHFSLELAGRKLVRLIFNGQVLQQDTKTLQNYGFFDNCVVHCLVHHPRTPPPSPNLNRNRSDGQTQNDNANHWDLGNILFASLSFLLGLAWYGRYQYAQLYTATTTVALIGLTGMFTVSLIGMYMPDVDGIRTQ